MGRLETANHRTDTVTLLLTLYEVGLALCAVYSLAIYTHRLIAELVIPNPASSLNLFFP